MRILFISAFYPPHIVGGWEQLVQDINTRLVDRGHTTAVLTSTYGLPNGKNAQNGAGPAATYPAEESSVHRQLTLESNIVHYEPMTFFRGRKSRLTQNLAQTRSVIEEFAPDVIFIHVMWNLARQIAWLAEEMCPGRVVYYVANDWPHAPNVHTAYWQDPGQRQGRAWLKNLLAPAALRGLQEEEEAHPLQFEHVLCVSHAVKKDLHTNAGIKLESLSVVYNGIEIDQFVPRVDSLFYQNGATAHPAITAQPISLLYAGSLVPHKGVHTAIEAMALLKAQDKLDRLSLTIVGGGHPDYEAKLHEMVAAAELADHVHFRGRVQREEMPAILQAFDVLIFPSVWEEPLARMTQEAMGSGLLVVGTLTGGTGELLVEGETGLTFEPEDGAGLARRIEELRDDPELCTRLVGNARQRVVAQFDIERMIDEIEAYLGSVRVSDGVSH